VAVVLGALAKKASSLVNFANMPITEPECSRVRLATVQHLIFFGDGSGDLAEFLEH
jgi:hypothetical protein